MLSHTLDLAPQAPQATTDLHRIVLGLEAGVSDECIYSLTCFDACIVEGIVNPTRDEGLWSRSELALLKLLQTASSGPLLTHVLHTLSLSLQLSDPESDALIPRLIDIVMGENVFTIRERQLALRCLSVLELDESETQALQRALYLIVRFGLSDSGIELQTLAVSLVARYVGEMPMELAEKIVPYLVHRLRPSVFANSTQSNRKAQMKFTMACLGVLHIFLETRPEAVESTRGLLISTLIDRLVGKCGCSGNGPCECCQACVSCLLRIGVHPSMREDLRPFMDSILQVAWNWKSGSPIAAQSLLNMMSGLLH
jgi:hypothetical protein